MALALISGGVAGFAALRLLEQRPVNLMAAEPRTSVPFVVASRDLAIGTTLTEEDLIMLDWPSVDLPEGFINTVPEALGRGVITPIRANEPVLETKIADRAAGGGLPIAIPPGMRAMSVAVNNVVGVAGFVLPGTRVDVLLTVNPDGNQQPITKIILQNIQVLTAGKIVQRDENGEPQDVPVVTLLVSPDDAEKLAHATNEGRIQLALRNTLDLDPTSTSGARVATLLSGASASSGSSVGGRPARSVTRTVQSPTDESVAVEMYRGGQRTLLNFQPKKNN
jgi:pilus assembly protein CpaB